MNDPLGFTRPHCPSPTSGTPVLRSEENCEISRQSEGPVNSPCFSDSPGSTPRPIAFAVDLPPKRKRVELSELLNNVSDNELERATRDLPSPKRQRVDFGLPRASSDHSLTSGSSAKSSQSSRSTSMEDMHLQWDWEPAFPAPSLRDFSYDSVRASQISFGTSIEKPFSLFNFSDGYEKDFDYQLSASQCAYEDA